MATLSHDVEHANDSISPIFDKEKEQRRLQQVQLIADIGNQVSDIVRTQGQLKAKEEGRAELKARGVEEPGKGASQEAVQEYQKSWRVPMLTRGSWVSTVPVVITSV